MSGLLGDGLVQPLFGPVRRVHVKAGPKGFGFPSSDLQTEASYSVLAFYPKLRLNLVRSLTSIMLLLPRHINTHYFRVDSKCYLKTTRDSMILRIQFCEPHGWGAHLGPRCLAPYSCAEWAKWPGTSLYDRRTAAMHAGETSTFCGVTGLPLGMEYKGSRRRKCGLLISPKLGQCSNPMRRSFHKSNRILLGAAGKGNKFVNPSLVVQLKLGLASFIHTTRD